MAKRWRALPFPGLLCRWLHWPELDQAEARSPALPPFLPHGCKAASAWAIFCLCRCVSRELDRQWRPAVWVAT